MFTQTTEMYVEINGKVVKPLLLRLSSQAQEIVKSYGSKNSPRSWVRDGLEITQVHEVTSYSDDAAEADSILVITFDDGSNDFFTSENDADYAWSSITNNQIIHPDFIKRQVYQEVTDFNLIKEFITIYNNEIKG